VFGDDRTGNELSQQVCSGSIASNAWALAQHDSMIAALPNRTCLPCRHEMPGASRQAEHLGPGPYPGAFRDSPNALIKL